MTDIIDFPKQKPLKKIYGIPIQKWHEIQEKVWLELNCPKNPKGGYEPWKCRDGRPGPFHLFHKRKTRNFLGIFSNRMGKDYATGAEICPLLLVPGKHILLTGATNALAGRCFDWIIEMMIPLLIRKAIPYRLSNSTQSKKLTIYPNTAEESWVDVHSFRNLSGLEGLELDLVVVGEAGDVMTDFDWIKEKMGARLLSRLGSFIIMSTPDMRNPQLKKFIDVRSLFPDVEYISSQSHNFTSYDCPYIDLDEIEEQRKILAPKVFQEKYLGMFVDMVGRCLPSFDSLKHVKAIKKPLRAHTVFASVDFGIINDPTAILVGYYDKKTLNIIAEYRYDNYPIHRLIPELHAIRTHWSIDTFVGDRDHYVLQELRNNNIPIIAAHKPKVIDDIQRLDNLFAQGNIIISPTCLGLLDELASYVWNDKEKPMGADHFIDALRYFSSAFVPSDFYEFDDDDDEDYSGLTNHQALTEYGGSFFVE